ncbi:MAG: ribbon-helix-helix protein, CopG family [Thermoleophilia bacterium]|nr:ribbon-helix-helix protein, CopG family [Thermoleophilia bacterium]
MRTTVRLDEQLMRDAKVLAAREGTTFTALIEDSLRERIARSGRGSKQAYTRLPVSRRTGGLRDGLDPEILVDNSRLADVMDGLDDPGGR